MKLSVFGLSGQTGQMFLSLVDQEDFFIKALVRNPKKLPKLPSRIETITGDVLDYESVEMTIRDCDTVVSFLGHSKSTPKNLQKVAIINILRAMTATGASRIIVMTGSGIFFPEDQPSFLDHVSLFFLKIFMRKRYNDGVEMCNILRQSEFRWTIVRCPVLNNRKNTAFPKVFDKLSSRFVLTVSRKNVCNFIIRELRESKFLNKAPVLSDF